MSTRVALKVVLAFLLLAIPCAASEPVASAGPVKSPAPAAVSLTDAVIKTLNENPNVRSLRENIAEKRGLARTAKGQFDWAAFARVSGESDKLPVSASAQAAQRDAINRQNQQISFINRNFFQNFGLVEDTVTDSYTRKRNEVNAGVTKQYRNGILFRPSVTVVDLADLGDDNPVSRSDVNATVVVPLVRGFGRDVAGANEMAARKTAEATELQTYQEISARVLLTIAAYYNCLAARQSLALNEDIFKRAEDLLDSAKKMIDAGLLEPAFIHQAEAKLANNRADLTNGENALYAARQSLGLAMGMGPTDLCLPPLSTGSFPLVADSRRIASVAPQTYVELARRQRLDYQAALAATQSEEIRLKKDRNAAKSRVDLTVRAGYAGLSEDGSILSRETDSLNGLTGVNGGAILSMDFPFENNVALGQVDSRLASIRRLQLNASALLNEISSTSLTNAEAVRNAAVQYELLQKASEAYQKAVEFEWTKYKAGLSSLNLLIDLEDRYVKTRLSVVESIRRYAVALAQLKFSTGTLLRRKGDALTFCADDLHRGVD